MKNARQAAALLLSTDLRAVLADVQKALDTLHAEGVQTQAYVPLRSAYRALSGREHTPS